MATNLLIGLSQYGVDATSLGGSTYDTANPVENVITGPRSTYTQLATAGTTSSIDFNMSSASRTVDYLYVARANLLKAAGSKRVLLTAYNGATTSIAGTSASFQSTTLYGPRGEDAIFTSDYANSDGGISMPYTLAGVTKFTFWAAGSGTDPSNKYKFSKVYFGQWLDFGRDPIPGHRIRKRAISGKDRESAYVISFDWLGITDAKRTEIISKLLDERQKPVFLYTRTYHDLLLEHRVIHCFVADFRTNYIGIDNHAISITFEEMI